MFFDFNDDLILGTDETLIEYLGVWHRTNQRFSIYISKLKQTFITLVLLSVISFGGFNLLSICISGLIFFEATQINLAFLFLFLPTFLKNMD